jgi:EmrB/QacA subfamily drug resistance transporter
MSAAAKLALIGLGTLAVPLDTAVNIAFPHITGHFGLPLPMIQWVVIAYVLTHGSLMLAMGRIGDIVGHARVFRLGLAWSVLAYAACALAPTYPWLLAARVMQGVGAALVISCGAALATSLYPESQRGRILGWYALCFAAGSVIGPAFAGLLVDRFGWPVVFWFRIPIALLALLLLRDLPAPPRTAAREPFDAPGALLLTATLVALLLGINQARHLGTGEAQAIGLLALAGAGLAGFLWRARRAPRPLIALHHFRSAEFSLASLGNVLVNLAAFSVLLFVPYYLARIAGLPSGLAGFVLASGPLGTMLASPLAGWLLARMPPRPLTWAGMGMVAAGLFLVGRWSGAEPVWWLVATLFLTGAGLGLQTVAYTDLVTGAMPRADRGVAGSLAMMTRTLGLVVAASLLTLLFAGLEFSAAARGAAAGAAFLAAFGGTLAAAAAVPAGFLMLSLALRAVTPSGSAPRAPRG